MLDMVDALIISYKFEKVLEYLMTNNITPITDYKHYMCFGTTVMSDNSTLQGLLNISQWQSSETTYFKTQNNQIYWSLEPNNINEYRLFGNNYKLNDYKFISNPDGWNQINFLNADTFITQLELFISYCDYFKIIPKPMQISLDFIDSAFSFYDIQY